MKSKSSIISLLVAFGIILFVARAEELHRATVTRVINQVEVVPANARPEPAAVGTSIQGNTGIQTGAKSLAELTFPDQTLARLGSNTLFSFDAGTRSVDLENGTILLQVPKHAGGAKIKTAPVTAAITGTTVLIECSRGKKGKPGIVKIIVIEGSLRLTLNNKLGESVVVNAGQEVSFSDKAKSLPEPQDVDLALILKTSKLVNAGPLGNQREITNEIATQKILKEKGVLVQVNFGPRNQDPARMPSQIQNAVQNQRNVVGNPPQPHPPTPVSTPPPPPPPPIPKPSAAPSPPS